jgi:parallel beta-helix repeat protein
VTPTPTPTPPTDPGLPANARYVAPNGSDNNPGTAAAPWQTLQKAANVAQAGDTIVVRAGTYSGFTMSRSGTSSAPITFRAYPAEKPVVDGRDAVAYTIRLTSVAWVNLDGLTVTGGYADRQAGGGLSIEGSSYVSVTNSVIHDNKAYGVRVEGSKYVTVAGNDIYGNANGVKIGTGGEGVVVRDNDVHDNDRMMVNTADIRGDDVGGEGIALVKSTGHVLVSGNRIWGNRAKSYDYGYDGGAFSIYAASNWTITGNTTWDNRNIMETGTDSNKTPCDNNQFTRNLSYGATTVDKTVGMVLRCASNTLVANNTFRGTQDWVFGISHNQGSWGGSVDGLKIVNNVISVSVGKIFGIDTDLPSSVVIDYNLLQQAGSGYLATFKGVGTLTLAGWRSMTGYEMHGITGDPMFVNAAANDYRLAAGSPALDRAVAVAGVTDGYAGSAPDLGFAERN